MTDDELDGEILLALDQHGPQQAATLAGRLRDRSIRVSGAKLSGRLRALERRIAVKSDRGQSPIEWTIHPDFHPPRQRLLNERWDAHPEHDHLVELKHETRPDRKPAWQTVWQDDEEDPAWTELVFRPVDAFDSRGPYRLGRWPKDWLDEQERYWAARLGEHDA